MIATSAFVMSFVFAAGALAGQDDNFTMLDTDGNGLISPEEAAVDAKLSQGWDAADMNKDGQLERAEFSALEGTPDPETGK